MLFRNIIVQDPCNQRSSYISPPPGDTFLMMPEVSEAVIDIFQQLSLRYSSDSGDINISSIKNPSWREELLAFHGQSEEVSIQQFLDIFHNLGISRIQRCNEIQRRANYYLVLFLHSSFTVLNFKIELNDLSIAHDEFSEFPVFNTQLLKVDLVSTAARLHTVNIAQPPALLRSNSTGDQIAGRQPLFMMSDANSIAIDSLFDLLADGTHKIIRSAIAADSIKGVIVELIFCDDETEIDSTIFKQRLGFLVEHFIQQDARCSLFVNAYVLNKANAMKNVMNSSPDSSSQHLPLRDNHEEDGMMESSCCDSDDMNGAPLLPHTRGRRRVNSQSRRRCVRDNDDISYASSDQNRHNQRNAMEHNHAGFEDAVIGKNAGAPVYKTYRDGRGGATTVLVDTYYAMRNQYAIIFHGIRFVVDAELISDCADDPKVDYDDTIAPPLTLPPPPPPRSSLTLTDYYTPTPPLWEEIPADLIEESAIREVITPETKKRNMEREQKLLSLLKSNSEYNLQELIEPMVVDDWCVHVAALQFNFFAYDFGQCFAQFEKNDLRQDGTALEIKYLGSPHSYCLGSRFISEEADRQTIYDCPSAIEGNRCFFLTLGIATGIHPFRLQHYYRSIAEEMLAEGSSYVFDPNFEHGSSGTRAMVETSVIPGACVDIGILNFIWHPALEKYRFIFLSFDNDLNDRELFSFKNISVFQRDTAEEKIDCYFKLQMGHFMFLQPQQQDCEDFTVTDFVNAIKEANIGLSVPIYYDIYSVGESTLYRPSSISSIVA